MKDLEVRIWDEDIIKIAEYARDEKNWKFLNGMISVLDYIDGVEELKARLREIYDRD